MKKFLKNYELREFLIKIGISSNLQGFYFIQEAVEIIRELEKKNKRIAIMGIYKEIAERNKINTQEAETLIRRAIKRAYKINEGMKKIYTKAPVNSVFLCDLAFNLDVLKNNIL